MGVLPPNIYSDPHTGIGCRSLLRDPRHARCAERGVVAAAGRALRPGEYAPTVYEDSSAEVDRANAQEAVAQDDWARSSYIQQSCRALPSTRP